MAAQMLLFLLLFRSKYRRKSDFWLSSFIFIAVLLDCILYSVCETCKNVDCINGVCSAIDGKCVCEKGWQGPSCQFCGGRILLTNQSGYISDGPGNYSVDIQCTWLIDAGRSNVSIRLRLEEFSTECNWDHLYVHNGDSAFAPLVAVYSGISKAKTLKHFPEVVTESGYAFLHFYSDAAFNMTGFNISYSVKGCPQNCSNHGFCLDGVCTCWGNWKGDSCNIPDCTSSNCPYRLCDENGRGCTCKPGYTGPSCDISTDRGYWDLIRPIGWIPEGRSSHQVVLDGSLMWVVGGEYFNYLQYDNIIRYNFELSEWSKFNASGKEVPPQRYGHSLVLYKDNMYMYGGVREDGVILNDLWKLEKQGSWTKITVLVNPTECHQNHNCIPLAAVGHTATAVGEKMVVIFGHNPKYGYLNSVQEYHFESREWRIMKTNGAIVKGGYGHSSVLDPQSGLIYVHGGYQSDTPTAYTLVDNLYSYNPHTHTWYLLTPSFRPRYFHSAVMLNSVMLVFGGNTHNGSISHAQCFSADFEAYDPLCDTWKKLGDPSAHFFSANAEFESFARIGHTAVVYKGSMYIYGGFSGKMSHNFLKFTPGSCSIYTTSKSCVEGLPGLKCVWNKFKQKCQPYQRNRPIVRNKFLECPKIQTSNGLCNSLNICPSCLHSSYNCVWCGTYCAHQKCNKNVQTVTAVGECSPEVSSRCDKLHNCFACHTEKYCGWHNDNKCYIFVREIGNKTEKAALSDEHRLKCADACSERKTCQNCTEGHCLWCNSQHRCIDNNAYIVSFPYGQCRDWTNHSPKCPAATCSEIRTCEACQSNPECGWCDDGNDTGLGLCMEGSSLGPMKKDGAHFKLANNLCPAPPRWYFSECPRCQCNGHSKCDSNDVCIQPCSDLTEGPHCEHCNGGYFGNAINGGTCSPCECNNHATLCHRSTGKCYCTTKGVIGHRCDRCDEPGKYFGDPREGSCFYNLTIDYQFTFNMSKPDDAHLTQINFKNTPLLNNVDVEFFVRCSSEAWVNITLVRGSHEHEILEGVECAEFKIRIPHDDLEGDCNDNVTFYVYVYGFTTPMSVKVSFSQHKTLDLLQFFITFSCCFLSLLLIAGVLWKFKQRLQNYRRQRRMHVEMENLASRPFARIYAELDRSLGSESSTAEQQSDCDKEKAYPTAIALEPCCDHEAAVMSVLMKLPTHDQEYALPGQSSLTIASVLISLGYPHKNNFDAIKVDPKTKNRKLLSPSNRDTCI